MTHDDIRAEVGASAVLQSMVPALLTQVQCDGLIDRATVPDPVSEYDVRCAIYSDDGGLRV